MALRPVDVFPGKIAPADASYPHGKARNVSSPGAGDGTPWNATYINEVFGFFQSLLDEASITPNGTQEAVGASQYLAAITTIVDSAVAATKESLFPVGALWMSAVAGNPATQLGFGTWVAEGAGRVIVGLDGTDPDFNTSGQTGGFKTHSLTAEQIGDHVHQWNVDNVSGATQRLDLTTGNDGSYDVNGTQQAYTQDPMEGDRYTSKQIGAGEGDPHNNVQPYVVRYIWRRTA